jgi:predicted dehydrogenase/nucleoside-diphosphate-sugar epimerase
MTRGKMLRVGVLGAGYVSDFHLEALKRIPSVEVVGVADLDRRRAAEVASRHGVADPCGSLAELTERGIDAVHILTPPESHAAMALDALARGCHVLVEKPLATDVEDCDRLESAAAAAGRSVCVVHSYLRDPVIDRALRAVRSGAIGDPVTFDYFRSSCYPPYRGGPLPPQYRAGGYPFRDLGVHALYLAEAFLGPISDVTAQFTTRGTTDPHLLYDEWRALVRCERGSGQIHLSWNVQPLQHVLRVQGTRGVVHADVFSMYVTTRRKTPLPGVLERVSGALRESAQIGTQVPMSVLGFLRGKVLRYHGLQVLVADFYAALAAGRETPFPPRAARAIIDWTERAARPADEAKRTYLSGFSESPSFPVVVTGANGFIGRRLAARLLDRGERIRVLVRRPPSAPLEGNPNVEVVLGDLGDPAAVERAICGASIVYHVGAAMRGGPSEFQAGTVEGTRNVIESALRHGVGKVVYVSSMSVLHMAEARPGTPIREDFPLEPTASRRGLYTQTKLEAERLVVDAARDRGLHAVILRPGQVFGPDGPLLTAAVARRMGRRLVILGGGRVLLPLVYVEDVVDALVAAADSDVVDGSIFHVADAGLTQDEVARRCLSAKGAGGAIVHLPLAVVYPLAFAVDLMFKGMRRNAPLSIYRVRSALAHLACDCTAARRRLGWTPKVGIQEGLRLTLQRG